MRNFRTFYLSKMLLAGALLLTVHACGSKSTTSSDNSTASEGTKKDTGKTKKDNTKKDTDDILIEAGKAAGYVTSSFSGVSTDALGLIDSSTNTCASGSYKVLAIGHSKVFSSGTFTGSSFSGVSTPASDSILELTCTDGSTQRCFIKAGDSGILCNKVADAILAAFETDLGKKLTDATIRGAAVSKVASSIVTSTQIPTPETEQFITDLQSCTTATDIQVCNTTAIFKSPFFDSFKIMKEITNGWTAEGLFLFVTGALGRSVRLDREIYTPIFDALAEARGDGFIESVRTLIANVVTSQKQKAQDGKYAFVIKCAVSINGTSKYFEPDLSTSNELSCNETDLKEILTSAGINADTYLQDIVNDNLRDSVPCTAPNTFDGKCWANLSMIATALSNEANRNDIDGTHTSGRGDNQDSVSLIDVMPQVIKAIQDQGIEMGNDGPPEITTSNRAAFTAAMEASKNYFLGLLGVYKFLNDTNVKDKKLSLNEIHEIFTGDKLMRSRLVAWGPGTTGVQVGTGNDARYYSPLLTPASVDGEYSIASIFEWIPGNNSNTTDFETFSTIFANAKPKFSDTFEMFTKIPTASEIESYVFNSSHHEDWNPMGQKYIYVAELAQTGNPITCKMAGTGPGQSMIEGTTVTCDSTQTGVSCDTDGVCTFPEGYAYPYILMERGWFGEDKGRLFAIAGRTNGLELRSNGGRGAIIKEYKSGNETSKCDASQVGKTINYIETFYCGQNTKCEEKITAFCMDMSAFGTPARKRFYPGGQLTVSNQSPDGTRWEWNVPLIGSYDGSDHSKDTNVCLHVPQGSFVSESSSQGTSLVTEHVNTTTGYLTLTGITGSSIKECSESAESGFTKYYLYNWKDFSGTEDMYVWLLDAEQKQTLQFKTQIENDESWESTYAKLSKTDVESLLSGKTVAGNAATQINGIRFHNPRHDPKFDPYCDDLDGNGACDCYALKTLSADRQTVTYEDTKRSDPDKCGLMDKAAEPTISELPYCSQCDNSEDAKLFFDTFGGKAGAQLADVNTYFQIHQTNFNIQAAVYCQFTFAGQTQVGQPKWVDWSHWGDATHPGCPAVAGETKTDSSQGTIRVINPKPMKNAFNIPRPNTLVKLINYATKTVGQGVTIDPTKQVFSLDEAMALVALRNLMPPDNAKIKDSHGNVLNNISPNYEQIQMPDSKGDGFSLMLKGLLYKAGIFTEADIEMETER